MCRKASFMLILLAVALIAHSPSQLLAQSALGSIGGLITDASGAVVPGAQVTLTGTTTGLTHETTTNPEGQYNFADVLAGTYAVTVKHPGFKTVTSSPILLEPGNTRMFDAQLQVGEPGTKIEVTAVAPTINTENGQLATTNTREELLNLPLNDRGVTTFRAVYSSNYEYGAIAGMRSNFGYYNVDGISAMAPAWGAWSGPTVAEFPLEAISEFKIVSNNVSAEYGDIVNLSVASRSGTNTPHGSLFFVTSNNALNAVNPFAGSKPKGPIEHDVGGSFGGPVYIPHVYNGRNRTFFYTTYERTIYPASGSGNIVGTVPTAAMRQGDFSALLMLANPIPITDPTTGLPFDENRIPTDRISAVSQNIQSTQYMPLPNFGPADSTYENFNVIVPNGTYNYKVVERVDHQLRPNDMLSFRFLRVHNLENSYDGSTAVWYHYQYRNATNLFLTETHTFTPTLVNEFRLGFQRDYSLLSGKHQGAQLLQAWGIEGINVADQQNITGAPAITFQNWSGIGESTGYFWAHNTFDLLNNLAWNKGKHMFKFGGTVFRNIMNNSDSGNSFGSYAFNGFATGFDYADFLLGLPHQTGRYVRSPNFYNRDTQFALYAQDDWRLNRKLTLNLGLRWEYMTSPVAANDMRFAFDPSTGGLVVPTQQVIQTLISPLFTPVPIATAAAAGYPARSLVTTPKHDLGPRIGFAYRPFDNDKTVVRGSYAIVYTPLYNVLLSTFENGPFNSNETFNNSVTDGVPALSFPQPFPGAPQVAAPGTEGISGIVVHPRVPYTQEWNLTLEHEFAHQMVAHLTYRGNRTLQLLYWRDLNTPPPSDGTGIYNENWFRYPNYYSISYADNGGSQFGGQLDMGVERKFTAGLTFQAGYTWARSLTDITGGDVVGGIQNPYNRRADWGPSEDPVVANKFAASGIYELPFGTGKHFGANLPHAAQQAFGNWQISWIGLLQSGNYNSPYQCCFDTSNTRNWYTRPDAVGNWHVANPSANGWFNPAAFAVPGCSVSDPFCTNSNPAPVGRFGNAGRALIVGPGTKNFDFGIFKYFTIREKGRLQFRMTATNFFNHTNLSGPDTTVTDLSAGMIGWTNWLIAGAGPRTIQLGLRYDF